jgi:hypothetical protein
MTPSSVHFPQNLSPVSSAELAGAAHLRDDLAQVIEMLEGPVLTGDGASVTACREIADGAALTQSQLDRIREVLALYVDRTAHLQYRTLLCWEAGDLRGVLDAAVDRTAIMPALMHALDVDLRQILDTP